MKLKIPLKNIEKLKQELRENTIFEMEEGLGMIGDMSHIHFKNQKNKGIKRAFERIKKAFDYYVVAELYKFFWNKEYICDFDLTGKYLNEKDKEFLLNLVKKYSGGEK